MKQLKMMLPFPPVHVQQRDPFKDGGVTSVFLTAVAHFGCEAGGSHVLRIFTTPAIKTLQFKLWV